MAVTCETQTTRAEACREIQKVEEKLAALYRETEKMEERYHQAMAALILYHENKAIWQEVSQYLGRILQGKEEAKIEEMRRRLGLRFLNVRPHAVPPPAAGPTTFSAPFASPAAPR